MTSRNKRTRASPIFAIFFDLDNTLIATRKADKLACNKLADLLTENYGVPCDVASSVCASYLKAFRKCPDNPAVNIDEWRHLLWTQALDDEYAHLANEIYVKWLQLRYHYLAMSPDVKSLLIKLRQHYLLGLITNGPSCAQWEKVKRLDLQSYFDVILVSGDLPWEKPNSKIFEQACQYLGVEPQNCIMVGDKLETDIQGGIEAHLGSTVWIPLAEADLDEKDPCPDYTITSVTELPTLLPSNTKTPIFRSKSAGMMPTVSRLRQRMLSVPDLEDCNSNSSDGS